MNGVAQVILAVAMLIAIAEISEGIKNYLSKNK